jgi:hypothetical protein
MADIDVRKLVKAIGHYENSAHSVGSPLLYALIQAAKAHLATLPMEVEFTRYLVVSSVDERGPYVERSDADCVALRVNGTVVVLTGRALLPHTGE